MMSESSALGTIAFFTGTVVACNPDGQRRELTSGDPVYAQDLIITDDLSTVAIDFADGSRRGLASRSQIRLDPSAIARGEFVPERLPEPEPEREPETSVELSNPIDDDHDLPSPEQLQAAIDRLGSDEDRQAAPVAAAAAPSSASVSGSEMDALAGSIVSGLDIRIEDETDALEPELLQSVVQGLLGDGGSADTLRAMTVEDIRRALQGVLAGLPKRDNGLPEAATLRSAILGVLGGGLPTTKAGRYERASAVRAMQGILLATCEAGAGQPAGDVLALLVRALFGELPAGKSGVPDAGVLENCAGAVLDGLQAFQGVLQLRSPQIVGIVQGLLYPRLNSDQRLSAKSVTTALKGFSAAFRRDNAQCHPDILQILAHTIQGGNLDLHDDGLPDADHVGQVLAAHRGALSKAQLKDGAAAEDALVRAVLQGIPLFNDEGLPNGRVVAVALRGCLQGIAGNREEPGLPSPELFARLLGTMLLERMRRKGEALPTRAAISGALQGILNGLGSPRLLVDDATRFAGAIQSLLGGTLPLNDLGVPEEDVVRDALGGVLGGLSQAGVLDRDSCRLAIEGVLQGISQQDGPCGLPSAAICRAVIQGGAAALVECDLFVRREDEFLDDEGIRTLLIGLTRGGVLERGLQPLASDCAAAIDQLSDALAISDSAMAPLRVRAQALSGLFSDGFASSERRLDDPALEAALAGVMLTLPTAAPDAVREGHILAMFDALLGQRLHAENGSVPGADIVRVFAALAGAIEQAALDLDQEPQLLASMVRGLVGRPVGIDGEGMQQLLGAMLDGMLADGMRPGRGMLVGLLQGIWAERSGGVGLDDALRGAIALLAEDDESLDAFTLSVIVEGLLGRLPRAEGQAVPAADLIAESLGALKGGLPGRLMNVDGLPDDEPLVALVRGVIGGDLPRTGGGIYDGDALATALTGVLRGLSDTTPKAATVSRVISALLDARIPADANGMFGADSIAPVMRGVLQGLGAAAFTLDGTGMQAAVAGVLIGGIEVGDTGAPGEEAIELAFQGVVAGIDDRERVIAHLHDLAAGTLAGGIPAGEDGAPAPQALTAALKGLLAGLGTPAGELPEPDTLRVLIGAALGGGLLAGHSQAPDEQAISVSVQGVMAALPVEGAEALAAPMLEQILRGILGEDGDGGVARRFGVDEVAAVVQGATVGFAGRSSRMLDAARQESIVRGVLAGGIPASGDAGRLDMLQRAIAGAFTLADWASYETDDGDLAREYLVRGALSGGMLAAGQGLPPAGFTSKTVAAVITGIAGGEVPPPAVLEPVVRGLFSGGLRAGVAGYDEPALVAAVGSVLDGMPSEALGDGDCLQAVVSGLIGSQAPRDAGGQLSTTGIRQALGCVLAGIGKRIDFDQAPSLLSAIVKGVLVGGVRRDGSEVPDPIALTSAVRGMLGVLERTDLSLPEIETSLPAAIEGALGGGLSRTSNGVAAAESISVSLRAVLAGLPQGTDGWPAGKLLQAAIRGVCGGRMPRLANGAPSSRALTQLLSGVLAGLPSGKAALPGPGLLTQVCTAVLGEGLQADGQGRIEREHLAAVMEAFVAALPAGALQVLGKRALPAPDTTRSLVQGILRSAGTKLERGSLDTLVANARGLVSGLPPLPRSTPGPESLEAVLAGNYQGVLPLTPLSAVSGEGLALGLQAGMQVYSEERGETAGGVWLQGLVRAAVSPGLRLVRDMLPSPSAKMIADSLAGLLRGYQAATGNPADPATIQVIVEALLDGGVRADMGHDVIRNSVAGVLAGIDTGDAALPEPALLQRLVQGVLGGGLVAQGVSEPAVLELVINAVLAGLPLEEPVPPPAALQAVIAGVLGKAPSSVGGSLDAATITRVLQGVLKGLRAAGSRYTSPEALQRALVAALSRMPNGNPPRELIQLVMRVALKRLPPKGAGLSGTEAVEQLLFGLLAPFSGRNVETAHLPQVESLLNQTLDLLPVCEHGVVSGAQASKLIAASLAAGAVGEIRNELQIGTIVSELQAVQQQSELSVDRDWLAFAAELETVLANIREPEQIARRIQLAGCVLGEMKGMEAGFHAALLAAVAAESEESSAGSLAAGAVKTVQALQSRDLEPAAELMRPLLHVRLSRSKSRQGLANRVLDELAGINGMTERDLAACVTAVLALDARLVDNKLAEPVLGDAVELLGSEDVQRDELPALITGMLLAWSGPARKAAHGAGSGSGRMLARTVIGGLRDAGIALNCADIASGLEAGVSLHEQFAAHLPEGTEFDSLLRKVLREQGSHLPGNLQPAAIVTGMEAAVARLEEDVQRAEEERQRQAQERREAEARRVAQEEEARRQAEAEAAARAAAEASTAEAAELAAQAAVAEEVPAAADHLAEDVPELEVTDAADLQGELDAAAERIRAELEASGDAPDEDELIEDESLSRLAVDESIPSVVEVVDDESVARFEAADAGDDDAVDGELIASPVEFDDADDEQDADVSGQEAAVEAVNAVPLEAPAAADAQPVRPMAAPDAIGEDGMPIHFDRLLDGNLGGINHFWGGEAHRSEEFQLDASASTDVIHDFNLGSDESDGDRLDIGELLANEGLDARPDTDLQTLGRYLRFLEENGNTEILIGHEEDADGDGSADTFVADHRVVLEDIDLIHDESGKRLSDQDVIQYLLDRHKLSIGKG